MRLRHNQKGAALLMLVFVFALMVTGFAVSQLDASGADARRAKKTAAALAEAKQALLGHTIGVADINNLSLPNPDLDSGLPEGSEAGNFGSTDHSLIGKFPWHSLETNPYKDGWSECLWYVVSGRFKNAPRTAVFNWDTQGQIDVVDESGTLIASNLAALIVAPGRAIDGQNRSLADASYTQCGGNYDAINYLDTVNAANVIAGQVNYFAGSTLNRVAPDTGNKTFVLANNVHYNDQFMFVTTDDIFDPLIKRSDFAAQITALLDDPQLVGNVQNIGTIAYTASSDKGSGNLSCDGIANTANFAFCENWKEMLLIKDVNPAKAFIIDGMPITGCGHMLVFGGKKTGGQIRDTSENKNLRVNYIEGDTLTAFAQFNPDFSGPGTFDASNPSADILKCIPSLFAL